MTTPVLSLPELAANQSQPHIPHNLALRFLEVVTQLVVADRVAVLPQIGDSPPPVDGDRYLLTAADSGGAKDDIAFYSNGWQFMTPELGWLCYVRSEATRYEFNDDSPAGWNIFTTGGGGGGGLDFSALVTDTTTARTLTIADANKYIRMTNAAANVVTVPNNSTEAFAVDDEVHVRQAGAGSTSLAAAGGVTLNGNTAFYAQHDTKTLKKVATNTWDIIGGLA